MNRLRKEVLRKCKSLSRVGRPSAASPSYRNLRSMSSRDAAVDAEDESAVIGGAVVFVGSSRRRYVISAAHLGHPLIAALIDGRREDDDGGPIAVNCEVVLFDHLLWMLDNAVDLHGDDDAMRELAQLYACS